MGDGEVHVSVNFSIMLDMRLCMVKGPHLFTYVTP